MKYIRVASDLHLEGFVSRNLDTLMIDFLPKDERDADAYLVLAGDISSAPDQLVGFIRRCQERFPQVIFVPGNHEYYRHNYDAWNSEMAARFDYYCPGLKYATGGVEVFIGDGVRFICGTMWADGGPDIASQAMIGHYINDFRLITRGDPHTHTRFTVQDMVVVFKRQKAEINSALRVPFDGKTVVVTHHMPSRRLVSARFWPRDGSDGCNGGFVGDCESILAYDHAPDIWIHGHTHDTIDMKLWETRVVCNPAGYRGEWCSEHNSYMPNVPGESGAKFIEL